MGLLKLHFRIKKTALLHTGEGDNGRQHPAVPVD